jgi:hypothetical protein
MYCPGCGAELRDDARFCEKCGMQITTAIGSQTIQKKNTNEYQPENYNSRNIESIPKDNNQIVSKPQSSKASHKKKGFAGVFIAIILASVIGGYFIVGGISWGEIKESHSYSYSAIASGTENVTLDIETASVNIRYNSTNMDELIQIDVEYHVEGMYLKNKTLTDVFQILWDDTESPAILQIKRVWNSFWMFGAFFDYSSMNVTLRTDVKYSIDAYVVTGNIDFETADNVVIADLNLRSATGIVNVETGNNVVFENEVSLVSSTGIVRFLLGNNCKLISSLRISTSTGSILLDSDYDCEFMDKVELTSSTGNVVVRSEQSNFSSYIYASVSTGNVDVNVTSGVFGGNFYFSTSTGNVITSLYNPKYLTNNVNWWMNSSTGNIIYSINQIEESAGNIIAVAETSTGNIVVGYNDIQSSVGAQFTRIDSFDYSCISNGGFSKMGNLFQSNDYATATNRYNLSMETGTGNIVVTAKSV